MCGISMALTAGLAACGQQGNNVVPVAPQQPGMVGGGCSVGQVMTQVGCLAQGSCPAGYGQYGSQCLYGTIGNGAGGYGYGGNGYGGYGNYNGGCAPGTVPIATQYGTRCAQPGYTYGNGYCPPGYNYVAGYGCR